MKAMSILSIIFSVFMFIYVLSVFSGGGIDEELFILLGTIASLWFLAFSIVATVNSFKKRTL